MEQIGRNICILIDRKKSYFIWIGYKYNALLSYVDAVQLCPHYVTSTLSFVSSILSSLIKK